MNSVLENNVRDRSETQPLLTSTTPSVKATQTNFDCEQISYHVYTAVVTISIKVQFHGLYVV